MTSMERWEPSPTPQTPQDNRHPLTPVEIEVRIREASEMIETIPDLLDEINARRYEAEATYTRKKAVRLDYWMTEGLSATQARARAEVECTDELQAWQATKLEYHYADDSFRAAQSNLNALLNMNRAMTAQVITFRG